MEGGERDVKNIWERIESLCSIFLFKKKKLIIQSVVEQFSWVTGGIGLLFFSARSDSSLENH